MTARIGIVRYGMGNVGSLQNALRAIDVDHFAARTPDELDDATHIIVPGVGAFPQAMDRLDDMGFSPKLRTQALEAGVPLLGICLGMQVLASVGHEHRERQGLNLIPGRVTRLAANGHRVPHVGWNDTHASKPGPLQDDETACYYYVHSYRFEPERMADVALTCSYGSDFVAGIAHDNVYGVQFHPEKSHKDGLALLKRFAEVPSSSSVA